MHYWHGEINVIKLSYCKKAVTLINLKTAIAHTEPLPEKVKQVKLSDLYTS